MSTGNGANGNGHEPGYSGRHVHERIAAATDGSDGRRAVPPGGFSELPEEKLHAKPRHPEDPPGAIATAAAEVCDPELVRGSRASALGKTMYAVEEDYLFGPVKALVDRLEEGIAGIRKGAVTIPAHKLAGNQLATVRTTETEKELEQADGDAAAAEANRLQQELEEHERRLEEDRLAEADARAARDAIRAERAAIRDEIQEREKREQAEDTTPKREPSVFEQIVLSPIAAIFVIAIDLVVTTVLLESPLSDMVKTNLPYGAFMIAAGVAASTLAAAAVGGVALAAVRLPGRVVGALVLAMVALIALKLIPALDAARAGDDRGLEALTAATLCACLVTAVAAYATTTFRYYARTLELAVTTDYRLEDLDLRVTEAEELLIARGADIGDREARCEELRGEIAALRTLYEQTESRIKRREAKGIRADNEIATISAATAAERAQEDHSREAAIAAAELAWRKARAEELPEDDGDGAEAQPLAIPPAPTVVDERRGIELWKIAAMIVLALSAIAGVIFGSPWVSVGGAVVAIVLLLLGGLRGRRPTPPVAASTEAPDIREEGAIEPALDSSSQFWKSQPDHMVAKYGRGEHDPTQGQ